MLLGIATAVRDEDKNLWLSCNKDFLLSIYQSTCDYFSLHKYNEKPCVEFNKAKERYIE